MPIYLRKFYYDLLIKTKDEEKKAIQKAQSKIKRPKLTR